MKIYQLAGKIFLAAILVTVLVFSCTAQQSNDALVLNGTVTHLSTLSEDGTWGEWVETEHVRAQVKLYSGNSSDDFLVLLTWLDGSGDYLLYKVYEYIPSEKQFALLCLLQRDEDHIYREEVLGGFKVANDGSAIVINLNIGKSGESWYFKTDEQKKDKPGFGSNG
jgi:hypothetical protein